MNLKTKIERKIHVIDAEGKTVGRLATQIANLLQGKHKPAYLPNVDMGDNVEVKNIKKLHFSGKKFEQKVYYRHSGYLGGLKTTPINRMFAENPDFVLRRAVKQMLPKNRLTTQRIARLVIN